MRLSFYPLILALVVCGFAAEESPVPIPTSAMVFDVDEDGICDSVAITYSRPMHRDSVPLRICLMWDMASATIYNPYGEGFSTTPTDNAISCNVLLEPNYSINYGCADGMYCSNMVTVGGLRLSENVKTSGIGKVYSFAEFKDKGKIVRTVFSCDLLNPNPSTSLPPQATPLKSGLVEYTVMDLLGRIVHQGLAAGADPVITSVAPGSYIMKIGDDIRYINIR